MTEIVAAHLERVARETATKVGLMMEAYGLDWAHLQDGDEDLVALLAAALAACAREARLQEANAAYWSWKLSHEDFGANQQKRLDELRKES